jgi:signal transduction histidine kinase/ActR/RegA family two-component response regulator
VSLHEIEPGFEALYDDAPCGLLVTRDDGLIEHANRTFCRWLGAAPDDLVGQRRFQDLLTMGGRIFHQTHFGPLLQMQGSVSEVKLDLKVAGGPLPIMVNAVRREHAGVATHRLAVFVAKERHAYERELMKSRRHAEALFERQREIENELRDADRRKDEFLAMLAHELRNPLAPIATSTQLLKLTAHEPARVQYVAEVIERQIGHLTNLVDDLLDVSRVTRGLIHLDIEPIGLSGVLASALEQSRPVMDSRAHSLDVRIRADGIVAGDRTRLVQIVANLLNNAAKYTPQGGRIAVTLDHEDGAARLDVVDNGIGIDAELLPHVFDLFSQAQRTPDRSQGGLGIGLALVRSLVALHGGSIEAHSEGAHRGSRFTLRFPLAATADAPQAPPDAASPGVATSAEVLLVDDNRDAVMMLADVLRLAGHEVTMATSAHDALEHIRRSRPPAVCILDIGLPDISGYELASRIRGLTSDRPPLLVALTGYGQPHDFVLSKSAGFDHHFVKPADPQALVQLVNRASVERNPANGHACA